MTISISWKKLGNEQSKSFKDNASCIEWCRKNYENIYSINGIITMGRKLSHFDVMDCLNGNDIGFGTW